MKLFIILLITITFFPLSLYAQKDSNEFEVQYLSFDSTHSIQLPKYMYCDSILFLGTVQNGFNYFSLIDSLQKLNFDKFYGLYDSSHVALIVNGCLSEKCFDFKGKNVPKQSYFWVFYPDEDSSKIFISGELNKGKVRKVFSFYKNGKKRSKERYSSSGAKSGKWKYFSENGKLIKRLKYRKGKLIREKNV